MMKQEDDILIEEFPQQGYQPLIDYKSWRVAVLKFCDDVRIENIKTMQTHVETDEVFVLLSGQCTLFSAGSGEAPATISKVDMEMGKAYNVKKGVWHNHTLDEEGIVLIVENSDTSDANSPIRELSIQQIKQVLGR